LKITHDEIVDLANRAGENDQIALAGILMCLVGTMIMHAESAMLLYLEDFSRRQIAVIDDHKKSLAIPEQEEAP
jgi:hypothetical protein